MIKRIYLMKQVRLIGWFVCWLFGMHHTLREENFAKQKIAELKITNYWSKKSLNRPPSLKIAEIKIATLRICLKNMELKITFSQSF